MSISLIINELSFMNLIKKVFFYMSGSTKMTLLWLKHKQMPKWWSPLLTANLDNVTMLHSDPHHGDLVMILHHWAAGLALTNKIRQHTRCHLPLIFCAMKVSPLSSQPICPEISVPLLTFL